MDTVLAGHGGDLAIAATDGMRAMRVVIAAACGEHEKREIADHV
jgi:hypothetical protein